MVDLLVVEEFVRHLWVSSMHRCAGIHEAMGSLTNQKQSEQHTELGKNRILRDNKDLEEVIKWFDSHEPFDPSEHNLKSISSGITAVTDEINCDNADEIGEMIQEKLDGVCFEDAVIKRKSKVNTLHKLTPGTKIGDKIVQIDLKILFTRLLALIQREEKIVEQFRYKLTPEQAALYHHGLMRKATKSVLRKWILDKFNPSPLESAGMYVVDGGALLHKVMWSSGTYKDVIEKYLEYVRRKYGKYHKNVCVVFDGFSDKFSTKTEEHERRGQTPSSDITITENM